MPEPSRNEKVRYAISRALKQRGLSHKEVAELVGRAVSTVGNKISLGQFTEEEATEWSSALGIEREVFLYGREPLPPNDYSVIRESMDQMRTEIDELRKEVNILLAWKAVSK